LFENRCQPCPRVAIHTYFSVMHVPIYRVVLIYALVTLEVQSTRRFALHDISEDLSTLKCNTTSYTSSCELVNTSLGCDKFYSYQEGRLYFCTAPTARVVGKSTCKLHTWGTAFAAHSDPLNFASCGCRVLKTKNYTRQYNAGWPGFETYREERLLDRRCPEGQTWYARARQTGERVSFTPLPWLPGDEVRANSRYCEDCSGENQKHPIVQVLQFCELGLDLINNHKKTVDYYDLLDDNKYNLDGVCAGEGFSNPGRAETVRDELIAKSEMKRTDLD